MTVARRGTGDEIDHASGLHRCHLRPAGGPFLFEPRPTRCVARKIQEVYSQL